MLHTAGFVAHWGMFFPFHGGFGGVLFTFLFFMFVFSMMRGRGGRYYRGPRGYGQYRGYYPQDARTPGNAGQGQSPDVPSPTAEMPRYGSQPAQDGTAGQGAPYGGSYEPGEPTVRIESQAGTSSADGTGGGTDTIRVDRAPGNSGEPTRPL